MLGPASSKHVHLAALPGEQRQRREQSIGHVEQAAH